MIFFLCLMFFWATFGLTFGLATAPHIKLTSAKKRVVYGIVTGPVIWILLLVRWLEG